MLRNPTSLDRRKVLSITGGALLGSGLSVKSVAADSEEIVHKKAPLVEANLTYNGNFEEVKGITIECGEPHYIIHKSDLYIGDVDIMPYLDKSPLALLNSQPATEGEVLNNTLDNRLPLVIDGGLKKEIVLPSEVDLPEIIVDKINSDSVILSVNKEEVEVQRGEEKAFDLEPQTVRMNVRGDYIREIEHIPSDDVEVISGDLPDTTTVQETKVEEISVTPSIRVNHHEPGNMYGVKDGVVLPVDDDHPISHRVMNSSQTAPQIQRSPVTSKNSSQKEIMIVKRGAN
ncbi:hypothetical protein ACLI4Z_09740 [Natrialbaceae archaeon A-arb3/5]